MVVSSLATDALANARSFLFVPGDRPDRFDKALAGAAHVVILDLEDGVDPEAKAQARRFVHHWLAGGGRAVVRVSAISTADHAQDRLALASLPELPPVMLAKTEDIDQIAELQARLPVPVIGLVETALGVANLAGLAAADGVVRLAFGSVDFAADLGASEDRDSMLLARAQLVLASRVARLPPPIDGVTRAIRDVAAVADDAAYARRLGFGGKLCIHPAQVAPVNEGFAPTEVQLRWARRVLAAGTSGAVQIDGKMVDRAVQEQARRMLAQADR